MDSATLATVSVNGRDHAWPQVPAVVICLDGCEPACLEAAKAAGLRNCDAVHVAALAAAR